MLVALLPAFNEEKRIGAVISKAYKYVDQVIVCDDGSTDSTQQIATDRGAEVIRHPMNMGYGSALRSLFRRAQSIKGNAFVTIDSDGQHDSAFVPALTDPILRGEADLVIGSRFLAGADSTPPHRRLAIRVITGLCDVVTGNEFTDLQSGFRAYSPRAIGVTLPSRPGMGASTEIVIKATRSRLRVTEVGVPIYYNGDRTPPLESARQFIDVLNSIMFPSTDKTN